MKETINMMDNKRPVPGQIQRSPNRLASFTLHIFLPVVALVCGVGITYHLLHTKPKAYPGKPTPAAVLVEVEQVQSGIQQTSITAMGEIIAAREIDLKPRVSGEITAVSKEFIPGGFFKEGEDLLSIDRTDYELVVRRLTTELTKAENDLALEMGNQRIARQEYSLLNEKVTESEKNLILRQPQLEKLKATREAVETELDQARLNLERTQVKAPFNGVLVSQQVNKGAKVNESSVLGTFVGTDTFWLKLSIPPNQLQWLNIPLNSEEKGSKVRIFAQVGSTEIYREGEVIRLIASLEEKGRMAQLLVRIDDPLSRLPENSDKPQMLLGAYVKAEIEGRAIQSGISLDRAYIHDNNTVWIMDKNGMLDIRPVEILFRDRDTVVIDSGLENGERLVTSTLSSPISGTPLRLQRNTMTGQKDQEIAKIEEKEEARRREKGVQ